MLSQLTIPRNAKSNDALDMEYLYKKGLRRVRDLCSREWTDHNIHDPGVTILEVLSYAITDLSFRAGLPVEDLLAPPDQAEPVSQPLFTAREILHNRPLTTFDYRRLLIDLPGVRNAWIKPAPVRYFAQPSGPKPGLMFSDDGTPGVFPVDLKGLYEVLLDYEPDLSAGERDAAEVRVEMVLHQNRNLCEDFLELDAVHRQNFILCGEFELEPRADIEQVKAEILYEVQNYLAPAVKAYSLQEMLDKEHPDGRHYTVDEIFQGPPLQHGFIPEDELAGAELREVIRLSDIMSIIMDIPGVLAVRDVLINRPGAVEPPDDPWEVPVTEGMKAHLNQDLSRLVFYKQDLPVMANEARVEDALKKLVEAERVQADSVQIHDFKVPPGRFRDPGNYHAFQNHLPEIYGLGGTGLPATADANREAQALQLKAYLLFFEQILANYLAQLAEVRQLFSDDPALLRTYQFQAVESFRKAEEIYGPDPAAAIEAAMEGHRVNVERRNRFLDHLISRFAEQFSQFAHTMFSMFEMTGESMVSLRCDFLKSYAEISRQRGLAYNYTLAGTGDIWNSTNVSGLHKRLCKLLGISDCRRRNLANPDLSAVAQVFTSSSGQFRFRVRHSTTNKILIRSSKSYSSKKDATVALRLAIWAASLPTGYAIATNASGDHHFNVVDESGGVLARGTQTFNSRERLSAFVEELMRLLREQGSDEGMYIVEQLLLRPEPGHNDAFLEICIDPGCIECPEADPYSYRMQIVLPAFGARFGNMDFRRYAEQVIRTEVPAHILPKICWLSLEAMAEFETVYQDWLKLKCGKDKSRRKERVARFLRVSASLRNVYPVERLHECGSGEIRPQFIVGKRALGSMKTD